VSFHLQFKIFNQLGQTGLGNNAEFPYASRALSDSLTGA